MRSLYFGIGCFGAAGTAHLKGSSRTHVPQQAPTATYQEFYGQAHIHQAIIVRSDGSAVAQYPSGDGIAVAVDLEHVGVQALCGSAAVLHHSHLRDTQKQVGNPACRPAALLPRDTQVSCTHHAAEVLQTTCNLVT